MWSSHYPSGSIDHLTNEGAVIKARETFLKNRPNNLDFLFRKRYEWMNKYTEGKMTVIDLGCGLGMSREFVHNPNLVLTDINDYSWVDQKVDALNPPFKEGSVDVFICGHIVHHLAYPMIFFEKIHTMLKPGGYVVIQELEISFMFKILLWLMKNEGWSIRVNVFNRNEKCTPSAEDPWSANCAIPHLLFSSPKKFEKETGFTVLRNELCECLTFPLSGGVLAKVPMIPLPLFILRIIDTTDALLVFLFPGLFALGRRVVLSKKQTI